MYGIVIESGNSSSSIKAGVNNCKMSSFKLVHIATENYTGHALDVVFSFDQGEKSIRFFPVNEAKIKQNFEANPNSLSGKPRKLEDVIQKEYSDLSSMVKHLVTGFVTEDVWNASITAWLANAGGKTTFEQFVTVAASMLPPNYASIPAKVVVGYPKNSKYYEIPRKMYLAGNMFTTDLNETRILVEPDTKYFKMTPWGNAEEPSVVGYGNADF